MNHNQIIKTKRTNTVTGSPDPLFNETFSFKAEQLDLDTTSLSLSVLQEDEGDGKDMLAFYSGLKCYNTTFDLNTVHINYAAAGAIFLKLNMSCSHP